MATKADDFTHSLGLLILRVGIGCYMLTHGIVKLQMLLAGKDVGDPIGIGVKLSMVLVTIGEFGGPILVIAGLVTRIAALLPLCSMLVAAFVVHVHDPWTMQGGASKEPALLYGIAFLAIAFLGPGRFSFDAMIRRRRGHG